LGGLKDGIVTTRGKAVGETREVKELRRSLKGKINRRRYNNK